MTKTMKTIPWVIKTNGSVTLYLNDECMTVAVDHPNYSSVVDALKSGKYELIESLINVSKAITEYSNNGIKVVNGEVFYGEYRIHNTLTSRIVDMMREGFKFDHMIKFLENLLQNPSSRAVEETYRFLENYGLPITDDGCFLAYKAVRNNYKDIYSGNIDNSVGSNPSMPRFAVDEVYERDCSTGLHVGALDYVVKYGHFVKGGQITPSANRLMIVKVNPKNVVSVPKYENHPKMRVCEYVVVSEIKDVVRELDKIVYTSEANPLEPDNVKRTSPKTTLGKDLTSDEKKELMKNATYSDEYNLGYDAGEADKYDDCEYGENRDYSKKGNYLLGYNDGYNDREYYDPSEPDVDNCDDNDGCCCGYDGCDECRSSNAEDEYIAGFDCGVADAESGRFFQESLTLGESDAFVDGYRDGYRTKNWKCNN